MVPTRHIDCLGPSSLLPVRTEIQYDSEGRTYRKKENIVTQTPSAYGVTSL